jgi:hypothetical protein
LERCPLVLEIESGGVTAVWHALRNPRQRGVGWKRRGEGPATMGTVFDMREFTGEE